jgi:HK97 family phage prohead protease
MSDESLEPTESEAVSELRDAGDWEMLNERQQEQAEDIAELALKFGMFDQSTGANGAHYAPAENNPFKAEGLVCRNCVFFDAINNQCQVVSGDIEPEAVCKLWVIPESEIGAQPDEMMNENRFVAIAEQLLEKVFKETRAAQREIRTQEINFEIRALDETGMRFSGYAAVFNEPSQDLGGFVEYIKPGAFARSLNTRNRMMLLWNHDTSAPLASTRNGSLSLREDARGLFVEATLPDTNLGRDIAELVRSGTIDAMSFGFKVQKDSWNDAGNVRTLEDVSLFEISLVSYPAYESTAGTVAVRNYVAVADKTEIDATVLADAMNNFEAGNTLSTDQVEAITTVLSKLAPAVEEEKPNADLLALKKKKFDLLVKDLHIN